MNTTQNQNTGQDSRAGSTHSTGNGEAIRQGAQELKTKATEVAQDATREGKVQVEQYRNVAAKKVETIAESVKAAADKLQEGEVGSWSTQISTMADSLTRFSEGLRERSAEDVMRDVNRMARENPAVFVGTAVAVGFGLTRLMRATAQPRPEKDIDSDEFSSMESSADDAYTTNTISGGSGYSASSLGGGIDQSSDTLGGSTSSYGSTGGSGTGVGAGSIGAGLAGASSQSGQSGFGSGGISGASGSGLGQSGSDRLSGTSSVDDDTLGGSGLGQGGLGDNDRSRSS